MYNLALKEKLEEILEESVPMGQDFGNSKVASLAREALVELQRFGFVVFSGSEKVDLGDKRPSAICGSQTQAETLIREMWPATGYFEVLE